MRSRQIEISISFSGNFVNVSVASNLEKERVLLFCRVLKLDAFYTLLSVVSIHNKSKFITTKITKGQSIFDEFIAPCKVDLSESLRDYTFIFLQVSLFLLLRVEDNCLWG